MKLCIDIDWVSVSVKIYTILPKVIHHWIQTIESSGGVYPSCLRARGWTLDRLQACHGANTLLTDRQLFALTVTPMIN